MKKKILLPTDFSKNSWNAIQYAVKLYEHQACDFYILNTYSTEAFGLKSVLLLDPDDSLNKLAERRSKNGLGDILNRLMAEYPNPDHNFFVLSKPTIFLEAVEDLTHMLSFDLIVMGAKGISNERAGKYGRKTLEIIENIRECPVLVIPKNVTFDQPEEIVLATNFDTDFKVAEIKHLADIAKISNARIQVLSLVDNSDLSSKQKRNKTVLQENLEGMDHSFNVLHNVKMADAVSCIVEIQKSNMISYIDKKPSVWQRMGFGKPALGELGYHENVPILALRA